ncbi:DNA modification methylase [bacterium]|nr:DNA modification methylase [bacterium]
MEQLCLFDNIGSSQKQDKTTTFVDNMKLPIHRWFKYSAGFSADWVKNVINEYCKKDSFILDPFAGSGTTNVVANELGIHSLGYEQHYFVRQLANIKLFYGINIDVFKTIVDNALMYPTKKMSILEESDLLMKCYAPDVLVELLTFRDFYFTNKRETPEWHLFWLVLTSILRITSHVGTAQWQYILPNKTKKNTLTPKIALRKKAEEVIADIKVSKQKDFKELGTVIEHDARKENSQINNQIDLVITSPPYPNNYDYADATRLEMIFWKEISGWSDLYGKVRKNLVRSCSQHSAADKIPLDKILEEHVLAPIYGELQSVCKELEQVRFLHGGKKTYHTMLASYYCDMANVFIALRKAMKHNSLMCFVIGDSAPYGVYAPADIWLSKLAISAGFSSCSFEKTRDRNIKWKNRKHDVPLKEGRLWIKG